MRPPKVALTFTEYDLSVLDLALRGYLEGLEGDYDNDHVRMEQLREYIRQARARLARKEQA